MEFAFGMVKDSFDGPMPSPTAFLPWATAVQKVVRSGTTYPRVNFDHLGVIWDKVAFEV